jgi:hypothetical protein
MKLHNGVLLQEGSGFLRERPGVFEHRLGELIGREPTELIVDRLGYVHSLGVNLGEIEDSEPVAGRTFKLGYADLRERLEFNPELLARLSPQGGLQSLARLERTTAKLPFAESIARPTTALAMSNFPLPS